jgi:magnesium-transporting ATPase (P-type)
MAYPYINIWAVLVSALAFWALGALWYSPLLFSKRWQKEVGFKEEDITKTNMALVFGLSFIVMLFMVWALNFVINSHKPEDVSLLGGLHYGAFTGFFFSMLAMGINYLYQRRSIVLWLIDGLYMVLGLGIAGMILGSWR